MEEWETRTHLDGLPADVADLIENSLCAFIVLRLDCHDQDGVGDGGCVHECSFVRAVLGDALVETKTNGVDDKMPGLDIAKRSVVEDVRREAANGASEREHPGHRSITVESIQPRPSREGLRAQTLLPNLGDLPWIRGDGRGRHPVHVQRQCTIQGGEHVKQSGQVGRALERSGDDE